MTITPEQLSKLEARAKTGPVVSVTRETLLALVAHVREVERERESLFREVGEQARLRGEAEGKLVASQSVGVLESWRRAAKEARAERDALAAKLKEAEEARSKAHAHYEALDANYGALDDKAENVVIAWGMGLNMEGVIKALAEECGLEAKPREQTASLMVQDMTQLAASACAERNALAADLAHVTAGWKSAMERAKAERDELQREIARLGHKMLETSVEWAVRYDALRDENDALAAERDALAAKLKVAEEALEFYAKHGEGCRKIGSIGEPSRNALDRDGGKFARAALSRLTAEPGDEG